MKRPVLRSGTRRICLACALACGVAVLPLAGIAAGEAAFPNRPITFVVAFPAGGVIDSTARMLADRLQARLDARIVVENRPGAGGTIGAAHAASAAADGYTYLIGDAATQIYSPAIFRNVRYDPVRSFTPVGQISYGPLVMLAGSRAPADTAAGLLAALKTGGDRFDYASNGNGSTPHLAAEMFKKAAGVGSTHIPFSGGPAAMTALAAGDVTYSINHIPLALGIIATGRVKPVATTGARRSAVFPDLPTLAEAGVTGYEAYSWIGLFGPAGMPEPVRQKMSRALQQVLDEPELKKRMAELGDVASYRSADDFTRYIADETARWVPVIRASGISVD